MSNQQDSCRLCGLPALLCRSHIVPELAYTPIKNEKEQLYTIGHNVKTVQTGYFERLLCKKCEAILSGYESKFKQAWMDTIPADFDHLQARSDTNIIRVEVNDFASFKLFHLSVLWRAAISSGFKISPEISLGMYESVIRRMLLEANPGQLGDFPFLGTLKLDSNNRPEPTVMALARGEGRFETHHYYLMSYAYCDWIFAIAQPGPKWLIELEKRYRREQVFWLDTTPHDKSKSFRLAVDVLRARRAKL